MENNSRQIPTEHMNTLPDPTSMKKARTCKGNDEGKAKRGKETTIELKAYMVRMMKYFQLTTQNVWRITVDKFPQNT